MSGEHPLPKLPYSSWKAFLCWSSAFFLVIGIYCSIAFGLYSLIHDEKLTKGAEPALMLEFAEMSTAPVVEHEADILQPETVLEEILEEEVEKETEIEPEPEVVPETIDETPSSDMVEEVKEQPAPIKPKKPEPKKSPPKKNMPPKPAKPDAKIGKKAQTASAPNINTRVGDKFAAPANSGNKGGQGGSADLHWKQKVQIKINGVARRVARQNPGINGVATVLFTYDGNGNIKRTSFSKSTGKKNSDDVALKIAKQSSPLPPPPAGQAGEVVLRVQF